MNNLVSGGPGSRMFVTNVGLITTNGPLGPNIMTAAWTHHVSYEPPLIMVNIHEENATVENLLATKEFGISLASDTQNVLASISGRYSGKNTDKIALLKKLGFQFYEGKKINVPMVQGAALNAELKLIKYEPMGDHAIVIGQVIESSYNETAQPISYHAGKYWKIGENIPKPEQGILDNIAAVAESFKRGATRPTL